MTASLRVKNDKYYVVLTHTTDGKKNQTWVSTGLSVTGNEGKARQIMLDMLGEKPEQAAPPDMLFSDAVRRWLEDVRHRVDEVTYQGYEVQARAHILPYFDDLQIQLCDVDGETLQTYINVKAKFGRSDGHGGLSAVSLRQHKNVLNQTLKLAQRDGLIQTNPADLVVMPHAAQFTGTFYTEAQMRDLLTAVKNERLYPIIYVTALYGLRRSEVLGLKWDSINFAMQTLTIRHTVARVTKVVEKNKTKNASSFRSFPLTDDAVRLFSAGELCACPAAAGEEGPEPEEEGAGGHAHLIRMVKEYIRDNYQNPITLQSAAESVFVSQSYLSHVFKVETGQNFVKYLTDYRLREACRLLRETNRRVCDLVGMVGYDSPKYFSEVFKRAFGMTPNAYRRQGGSE